MDHRRKSPTSRLEWQRFGTVGGREWISVARWSSANRDTIKCPWSTCEHNFSTFHFELGRIWCQLLLVSSQICQFFESVICSFGTGSRRVGRTTECQYETCLFIEIYHWAGFSWVSRTLFSSFVIPWSSFEWTSTTLYDGEGLGSFAEHSVDLVSVERLCMPLYIVQEIINSIRGNSVRYSKQTRRHEAFYLVFEFNVS